MIAASILLSLSLAVENPKIQTTACDVSKTEADKHNLKNFKDCWAFQNWVGSKKMSESDLKSGEAWQEFVGGISEARKSGAFPTKAFRFDPTGKGRHEKDGAILINQKPYWVQLAWEGNTFYLCKATGEPKDTKKFREFCSKKTEAGAVEASERVGSEVWSKQAFEAKKCASGKNQGHSLIVDRDNLARWNFSNYLVEVTTQALAHSEGDRKFSEAYRFNQTSNLNKPIGNGFTTTLELIDKTKCEIISVRPLSDRLPGRKATPAVTYDEGAI